MRHRGSVLILVLWSLALFTAFAVTLGGVTRQRLTLMDRLEKLDMLSRAARSGIEKAKGFVKNDLEPLNDSLEDEWAKNKGLLNVPAGEATFSVLVPMLDQSGKAVQWPGVIDEERKINLNKSEVAVVKKLIKQVTDTDDSQAEELAYKIVDWRDSDSNYGHPQYGAEDTDYDDLDINYEAKDAPMETLDELLLIKGIKRDFFDKIKPFVTVHGNGKVNINTAYKETLLSLGLSDRLVDKIIAFRQGPDGKPATSDDWVFLSARSIVSDLAKSVPPIDGAEQVALSNLVSADKLDAASTHFSAISVATAPNGSSLEIEAVFDRTGKTLLSRSSGVRWPKK